MWSSGWHTPCPLSWNIPWFYCTTPPRQQTLAFLWNKTDSGNLMRFFFLVATKGSLSSVFMPHLSIMGFFQGFCCLLIKVKCFLVTQLVGIATAVVDKAYLRDQVALLEFNFCCTTWNNIILYVAEGNMDEVCPGGVFMEQSESFGCSSLWLNGLFLSAALWKTINPNKTQINWVFCGQSTVLV